MVLSLITEQKRLTKFLPCDLHTVGVSIMMELLAAHFSTCTELVTTIKGQASLLPCGCSLAATVTSRGFWPQLTRQTTSCSEWLVVRGCSFNADFLKLICYMLVHLPTLCLNRASVAQTIQNWMIGLKMNWRGCGRKWSWPNLRFYPVISLAGFRNHKKRAQWGFTGTSTTSFTVLL